MDDEPLLRLQLAALRDSLAMARAETDPALRDRRMAEVRQAYDVYGAAYEAAYTARHERVPDLAVIPGTGSGAALPRQRCGARPATTP